MEDGVRWSTWHNLLTVQMKMYIVSLEYMHIAQTESNVILLSPPPPTDFYALMSPAREGAEAEEVEQISNMLEAVELCEPTGNHC